MRLSPSRVVDYYLLTKILVTGSAGHLGEALIRTLRLTGDEPIGLDVKASRFTDDNLKVNELLFRRADIEDIVTAHHLARSKASDIGFDRFIVSATTPFQRNDAKELGMDAPSVLERCIPSYVVEFARRNWRKGLS